MTLAVKVVHCVTVGQFSCLISNPCTFYNIETYGYYYPHYDPTKFIQCGVWDFAAKYSSCRELSCPLGTVWDQLNGYCNYPINVGTSTLSFSCCNVNTIYRMHCNAIACSNNATSI